MLCSGEATNHAPLSDHQVCGFRGVPPMTHQTDVHKVCCVALELSKTIWVCAVSPPDGGRTNTYKLKAGDVDRLLSILDQGRARAMQSVSGPVDIVVCYEVGYDGFWWRESWSVVASGQSYSIRQAF